MTAREVAKQHAETIERLAHEVTETRDPSKVAQMLTTLQDETRQLRDAMSLVREEERQEAIV